MVLMHLQDLSNNVKEISVTIRRANNSLHVFVEHHYRSNRLFGKTIWLVRFYGISTFVGYLMPNPFLYK